VVAWRFDPEVDPLVVELFRRRSSGERLGVLEPWLEAEGQRLGRNWHLRAPPYLAAAKTGIAPREKRNG